MAKYEYTMGRELDLKAEQEKTLSTPVLTASPILQFLYFSMDVLYGSRRTLAKFRVIEYLARYPYWAWENGAYHTISRLFSRSKPAARTKVDPQLRIVDLGREAQDNEQWHLVIIDDLMCRSGMKQSWLFGALFPRLMGLGYFAMTAAMYWLRPAWSFAMNAKFESHAEHQYMLLVQENPDWESKPLETEYADKYPCPATWADLFRRIGLDERDHMYASIEAWEEITGKTF